MKGTGLNRFRTVLTARVAELVERFTRHPERIAVERGIEPLEETMEASQRVLAVSHLDREFNALRSARAALGGIEEGSYRTCHECGKDIHPKRLAAVRLAAFFIRCEEAADPNREKIHAPNRDFLGYAA